MIMMMSHMMRKWLQGKFLAPFSINNHLTILILITCKKETERKLTQSNIISCKDAFVL